jgi:tetratricopeptide (TPR) repeat protein
LCEGLERALVYPPVKSAGFVGISGMAMKLVNAGRVLVAFIALAALVPATSYGQSDAEKRQQAKEHYEKATRFYDVGKYGEAIAEYEQSYLLLGDPALLYNIGQAYRLWERPEEAIRSYKNYLRQRPEASNRTDVEHKIADLDKVVEERKRAGATPPPEPPPSLPPAPYAPGSAPPGYPAAGGVTPPPVAPVTPPAAELPPAGVVADQPPPETPARADRAWLVYSLLGVSGASLVTAGIAGAVGASQAKKLKDASDNRQAFDPSIQSNGKAANAVAVVAGLVCLATGGTAGYLLWRQHKSAPAPVTLVPAAAPGYAGGAARFTF